MTPDANDLCVFAVKRGYIESKEIYCNSLYPFYLALVEKYENSPYANGVMSDHVEVNPKTDCSALTDNSVVSFIPMTNVQEKTNVVSYDSATYEAVKKGFTVFQRGDLIWAKITPCMQNGKSCIVDKMPTEIGFGSTEFHVIRKRNDNVHMPFIWAILSSDNVLKAAQATFSGSAGQQRVSASFIENFPAVLPDYPEQVRLVAELEDKLQLLNQKLQQADELFAGMSLFIHSVLKMNEITDEKPTFFTIQEKKVVGERIDPEHHNPFYTRRVDEIRKHSFDTLGNIIRFSSETWNQKDYFSLVFPYIEISNVHLKENKYDVSDTYISDAPSRAKMIVRNSDIIVSTTRPHRGAVATVQCAEDEIQIASTGFCVLREMKRNDVLKEYLQWILLDDYVLLQMLQRSSGGNYPAIVPDELKKIVIPIPSIEDQRIICKEAKYRQEKALQLRHEAEQEWNAARAQFEKELLGE